MTIEQQLKALKKSRIPAPEAVNSTRRLLTQRAHYLSSIQAQSSVYRTMQVGMWQTWRFSFAHVRQVAAVLIITLLSGTGTMVARASMAAVSGDTLYPVKRNLIEKVELVLAPSAQDEATVYLRHVASRLDEIRTINERGYSDEERDTRLNQTVLSLNRDLTSASHSLQIAAITDTKPQTARAVARVAKQVANSTASVKVALSTSTLSTIDKSTDANLGAAVAQALTTVSLTEQSTLDILIAKLVEDPNDSETAAKVEQLLQEALASQEERVAKLEKPIWSSGNIEIRLKVRQAMYALPRDAGLAQPKLSDFDNLGKDMTQVKLALSEARIHLTWHRYDRVVEQLAIARLNLNRIEDLLNSMSTLITVEILPGALDELKAPVATTTQATVATTTAKVADEAVKK